MAQQLLLTHSCAPRAAQVGLEGIIRGMVAQTRAQSSEPADQQQQQQVGEAQATEEQQEQATSTSASASESSSSGRPHAGPSKAAAARSKVKVVANLPYNITKELLALLLPLGDVISDLHIMIQHETAERLTERKPGGAGSWELGAGGWVQGTRGRGRSRSLCAGL